MPEIVYFFESNAGTFLGVPALGGAHQGVTQAVPFRKIML